MTLLSFIGIILAGLFIVIALQIREIEKEFEEKFRIWDHYKKKGIDRDTFFIKDK